MYKKIYAAVDNSAYSEACCTAAVSLAHAFGADVIGSHIYAGGLHERRFRQMEATLPEQYMADETLRQQRALHGKLIGLGLRLISNCYLDSLEQRCREAAIRFSRKTLDGKNWEELVKDITTADYDLAVLGIRGHGTSRTDTVGSVCLRVVRHTRTDVLVVKELVGFDDGSDRPIVVAVDGSAESFGALRGALSFGREYDRPVEAVAAYDPSFHYAVFRSLVGVLSTEAARVFRFKQQEQLHEEIVDNGLARLYQTYLEVARRLAAAEGIYLTTTLLTGRAADELLAYAERKRPWLLAVGRIGAHNREQADIGSVTEQLLRLAPGNVLIASRRIAPPPAVWGKSSLRWTEEANTALGRLPSGQRDALRLFVQRLALEQGHTVVTVSLVAEALAVLRPRPADWECIEEAALAVATEALQQQVGGLYLCSRCAHVARGETPDACPECQAPASGFQKLDAAALEATGRSRPPFQVEE